MPEKGKATASDGVLGGVSSVKPKYCNSYLRFISLNQRCKQWTYLSTTHHSDMLGGWWQRLCLFAIYLASGRWRQCSGCAINPFWRTVTAIMAGKYIIMLLYTLTNVTHLLSICLSVFARHTCANASWYCIDLCDMIAGQLFPTSYIMNML